MPITHEWNGTVLTITSDSGTSSADLQGSKGDIGPRGPQGIAGDCVATDTAMLGGYPASDYVRVENLPSLDGYATQEYVDNAVKNADVDLTGYATKEDIEPLATSFYVDNEVEAVRTDMTTNYLLKNDSAVDSFKLNGKEAKYYIHTYNLLDNSDFTKPINQRGKTNYAPNDYFIDRWKSWCSGSNFTVVIGNGYIEINNNTDSNTTIYQRLVKGVLDKNKQYTLAYKTVDETIEIKRSGMITYGENYDTIQIVIHSNTSLKLVWAALYEGEYTADNLPPYVPKGYAAELAECQRYFVRIGGNEYTHLGLAQAASTTQITCSVVLPHTMRAGVVPTVSQGGENKLTARIGTTFLNATAITLNQCGNNVFSLYLTTTGATAGYAYDVYMPTGSWLDVSKDL